MLTVIAIIGILAAILIPVVGKAREAARGAQCGSNLRQWHHAWGVYALENDDRVPLGNTNVDAQGNTTQSTHWHGPLGKIAGYEFGHPTVFLDGRQDTIGTCPSASIDDSSGAHWVQNQNNERRYSSYGYNIEGFGTYVSNGWRPPHESQHDNTQIGPHTLRVARVSSRTIVFGDATNWHLGTQPTHADVSYRHEGRANFVTVGGSVFSATEPPPAERWYYGD